MNDATSFLTLPDRRLAYQQTQGDSAKNTQSPVVFFSGFASDMMGTKASFLVEKCAEAGRGFLRFDYRGHGQSSGSFVEGTIGDWLEDALIVFDKLTEGPQVLVGSSMGGWMALLVAMARPEKVADIVGIAAAPDFTEDLIVSRLSPAQREQLEQEGITYEEGEDGFRLPFTAKLIEEGRKHLILRGAIKVDAPVHLLQGQRDEEVPWEHALRIAEKLTGDNVRVTFVKDATHRFSRPEDLALLWDVVKGMG